MDNVVNVKVGGEHEQGCCEASGGAEMCLNYYS